MARATIGQIRVAAEQARVEAMKMESESKTPGARGDWIDGIKGVASRIEKIADELEKG
jgi:hypothetical protein